jgi:hypothetical protein
MATDFTLSLDVVLLDVVRRHVASGQESGWPESALGDVAL